MSSSSNQSSSVNSSYPVQTPQNAIMDQIAATASGMANDLYSWAQNTFAQTSAITNQAVGNFFQTSSNMLGLSQNLTNQYNNLFAPENAQLVADANSYASPERMAVDMGMAGATQAQAGQQGLANSEEALKSYGIDPSAGRYAALDKAAAVQNAANVAGAENQQRVADIATGQNLRSEAVQVGAQLPAAIANVNNTAIQANTGASNAMLANANTGANLYGLADKYLGTAMQIKQPFSASQGSSQSSGSSSSGGGSGGGGSGGGGSGGGGSGGGSSSGPAWMPQHGGSGSGGISSAQFQPGSKTINGPNQGGGGPGDPGGPNPPPGPGPGWQEPGGLGDPSGWDQGYGSGTNQGAGAFGNSNGQDWGNGNTLGGDTFGGSSQSQTGDIFNPGGTSQGGGSDGTGLGAYGYDPTGGSGSGVPQDWNTPPAQDPNAGVDWGNSGGSTPTDTSGGSSDSGAIDTSGSGSTDMSSMDYSDFARGGTVMMRHLSNRYYAPTMADGGQVPEAASPSHGARVDDVRAGGPGLPPIHLNANEFVIPRDVALWKGQEFFQNLINGSRKQRLTAPAQPSQKPVR